MDFFFQREQGSIFLCELVSFVPESLVWRVYAGKEIKKKIEVKRREKTSGKVLYKIKGADGRTTYIATASSS
jgi:hypothetical protein